MKPPSGEAASNRPMRSGRKPVAARPQDRRSREHPADARQAQARRCEAAASRKATVAELLAQDRQKLLMKLPFTGSLVMRLDLVPVSDVRLETASTDGDRIFVDVDFYSKLGAAERLFVLAHEVWHCALLHFLRRGDRWLPPARRHVWKGPEN